MQATVEVPMRFPEVHHFELRSRDERELRNRIATFGRAVCARDGVILDVTFGPRSTQGLWAATVVYELPAMTLPDDAAE